MNSTIEVVTPPGTECVSLDEMNLQLRVNNEDENDLVLANITAAREAFEHQTNGRIVMETTYDEHFDCWGDLIFDYRMNYYRLKLSKGKVTSITSVKYYDANDVEQTLSSYTSDLTGIPALITTTSPPALSTTKLRPITVRYVAGYPLAIRVPQSIKLAIKSLAAAWYWEREGEQSLPEAFINFCGQWDTGTGVY